MTDTRRQQTRDVLEADGLPSINKALVTLCPPRHVGTNEHKMTVMAILSFPDSGNPRTVTASCWGGTLLHGTLPPQVQIQVDALLTWLRQSLPPDNPYYVGMFAAVLPEGKARDWVARLAGQAGEAAKRRAGPLKKCSRCLKDGQTIDTADGYAVICQDVSCAWNQQRAQYFTTIEGAESNWNEARAYTGQPDLAATLLKEEASAGSAVWQGDDHYPPSYDAKNFPCVIDAALPEGAVFKREWLGRASGPREEAQRRANAGETVLLVEKGADGEVVSRVVQADPVPCSECKNVPAIDVYEATKTTPEIWEIECMCVGYYRYEGTRDNALAKWKAIHQPGRGHNGHSLLSKSIEQCGFCLGVGLANYPVQPPEDFEFTAGDLAFAARPKIEQRTCHACNGIGRVRRWVGTSDPRPRH